MNLRLNIPDQVTLCKVIPLLILLQTQLYLLALKLIQFFQVQLLQLVKIEVSQNEMKPQFWEEAAELLWEPHHVLEHDQHRVFHLLKGPRQFDPQLQVLVRLL